MLKNYVITTIGYSASKYKHDIVTMFTKAHSLAEARGFGLEDYENHYPNNIDVVSTGFEITEDMLKI